MAEIEDAGFYDRYSLEFLENLTAKFPEMYRLSGELFSQLTRIIPVGQAETRELVWSRQSTNARRYDEHYIIRAYGVESASGGSWNYSIEGMESVDGYRFGGSERLQVSGDGRPAMVSGEWQPERPLLPWELQRYSIRIRGAREVKEHEAAFNGRLMNRHNPMFVIGRLLLAYPNRNY